LLSPPALENGRDLFHEGLHHPQTRTGQYAGRWFDDVVYCLQQKHNSFRAMPVAINGGCTKKEYLHSNTFGGGAVPPRPIRYCGVQHIVQYVQCVTKRLILFHGAGEQDKSKAFYIAVGTTWSSDWLDVNRQTCSADKCKH
jgi:hypothetical protein